jgi:NifB/MoaA-like Fe-S oxidoreductase
MNNRFAGEALGYLKRFNDAGIKLNCQLVLVPEYNDGDELIRSLEDLTALENVDCIAKLSSVRFQRIRRITGYLVGTLDRFNNAKRAEVNDRVKHIGI